MGRANKALLKIDGVRIIEGIAAQLCSIFPEVIVVTNTPEEYEFLGLPMIRDVVSGCGSLGGLFTGLQACRGTHGFLVACDMPFLDRAIIEQMTLLIGDHDVVVPRIAGWLEPLHAAYSTRCIPFIRRLIDKADLRIISLFSEVDVLELPQEFFQGLDPSLRFCMNINSPADLDAARRIAPVSSLPKQ
jgi:molybdopterin-guanine dinucleotide biosynthesis protein A